MRRNFYKHDHIRRGFIKWISIFVMVFAIIAIGVLFYESNNILNDNTTFDASNKAWIVTTYYLIQFILISTISSAIIILYLLKFSDEFLIENKYALISFGLIGGQFIVPLIITYGIPNNEATTRSSAKIVISKLMAIFCISMGIMGAIDLGAVFFIAQNSITINQLLLIAIIPAAPLAYGLINYLLFMKDRIDGIYESNKAGNIFKGFFAVINIFIITFGLILTILSSFISIISAIASIFSSLASKQGFLRGMTTFWYAQLQIIRGIFIIKMASQTIKTIYARKHYAMKPSLYLENHLAKIDNA